MDRFRWVWLVIGAGAVTVWALNGRYELRGCSYAPHLAQTAPGEGVSVPAGCEVFDHWTGRVERRPPP